MATAPRKEIGGRTYVFGTLPATTALDIEPSVIPILGAVIEELGKAGISIEALVSLDLAKLSIDQKVMIMRACVAGLQKISALDYTSPDGRPHLGVKTLMRVVFAHVTVIDGAKAAVIGDNIDGVFTGRPRDVWAVFGFALWETFKGFLGDAAPSVSSPVEAATA